MEYVRIECCEEFDGKVFYVVSARDGYPLRDFCEADGDSEDMAYEWAHANGYVVEE